MTESPGQMKGDDRLRLEAKAARQHCWDFLGAPFRLLWPRSEDVRKLGLTSRQDERYQIVLPEIRGRLLDIGAGTNELVERYGSGLGVDIHDWGGGATVLPHTRTLPLADQSFDTVTLLACLNHIPHRLDTLREVYRVLRPGGRILITMIGPLLGWIGHLTWWYGGEPHPLEGEDDAGGLTRRNVRALLREAGFDDLRERGFVYGMNRLYLARKLR